MSEVVPQDPEAEAQVLGAMMLDAEVVDLVVTILEPEDFLGSENRLIFQTILDLYTTGKTPDVTTIVGTLKDHKQLSGRLTPITIRDLADGVMTTRGALRHAHRIVEKAQLRRLAWMSSDIGSLVREEGVPEDILTRVEEMVFSVTRRRAQAEVVSMERAASTAIDKMEAFYRSEAEALGLPTGYLDLDDLLGGLLPGSLILIAARPSVGKTALATCIARNAALKNERVGFFSLEMTNEEIATRLICSESLVPSSRIRRNSLVAQDFQAMMNAAERIATWPIDIIDDPHQRVSDIAAQSRRLVKHGLGLVIVDYVQLIQARRRTPDNNRTAEITEISRELKLLAKELQLPIVVCCQLNREVEHRKGKPRLADLRDSGALEQDADVVILLHREEDQDNPIASFTGITVEAQIAKNRNGPIGVIKLNWRADQTTFYDAPRIQAVGG